MNKNWSMILINGTKEESEQLHFRRAISHHQREAKRMEKWGHYNLLQFHIHSMKMLQRVMEEKER